MVFGGTCRRGLNNTSMSEDGSPSQTHGGGKPEGKEGGILTHPRDVQPIRSVFDHDATSVCMLFISRITPGQRGRGKNVQWRANMPAIEHLRTQTPLKMGPLLSPVPFCPNAFLIERVGYTCDAHSERAFLRTMYFPSERPRVRRTAYSKSLGGGGARSLDKKSGGRGVKQQFGSARV